MWLNVRWLVSVAMIAGGVFITSSCGDHPGADGQADVAQEGFTFRLTPLTDPAVSLQHGIYTILTLNMIENGGSDAVRIGDPPEFPLTATISYQTVEGQKRKVSSSYGYRC